MPDVPPGWALIRVLKAGICGTDIEITKGYKGFKGILGHEFVGIVRQCHESRLIGKRVAGEINVSCDSCRWCKRGLLKHCLNRKVLGIHGLNGCMADYCVLPVNNLHEIPESVSDDAAVMLEPFSAAAGILEQVPLSGKEQVVVIGDGRLGILCAWALGTRCSDVTLVGRHPEKLNLAGRRHLKTTVDAFGIEPMADIVVDATGSASGLKTAISLCRPKGTIVLKTTITGAYTVDLAPVVINEQTIIGSRCGSFEKGVRLMAHYPDMDLSPLITTRYPIREAVSAFRHAQQPDAIKVVLEMHDGVIDPGE